MGPNPARGADVGAETPPYLAHGGVLFVVGQRYTLMRWGYSNPLSMFVPLRQLVLQAQAATQAQLESGDDNPVHCVV